MENWDPWEEDAEDEFLIWLRKHYPDEDGWKFIIRLDFENGDSFGITETTKYLPRLEMITHHSSTKI